MIEYFISGRFIESVTVVLFGLAILYAIRTADRKYIHKKSKNASWTHSAKLFLDFLSVFIVIIVVLFVLSINGVNVRKYFASLGIAGIAIGFAAQDLLKDLVMGVTIVIENYFKPGDVVIYKGRYGKITSFNLKTTKMKMLDDESIMNVPNRNIDEISLSADWFDLDIPIGYDVDLPFSRFIVQECCRRIERLRYVYSVDYQNTQDFEDSWILYRIRVHCMVEKRFPLRRAANAVVQDVFYEHKLGFPYPVKVIQNVDPDQPAFGADFINNKSKEEINKYNKVYELGSGAAKSKRITIDKKEASIKNALDEAERYTSAENLDKKMRMRIRLLSEEILTLTRSITNIDKGEFYIERNNGDYEIRVEANAKLGADAKEIFKGISSDGSFSGTGSSIINAINSMFHMKNNHSEKKESNDDNTMENSISSSDGDYRWSLNIFNEKQEEAGKVISSDATKMSVLNSLAEDVRVSVKGDNLSIVVLVKGHR